MPGPNKTYESVATESATVDGLDAPKGSSQRNVAITSRKAPRKPVLVMEYDDGVTETYPFLTNVHGPAGVPAVVGQVPNEVGDSGMLARAELAEMENDGWEIANHGRRFLGNFALTADAAAGDTQIYVENNAHGNRVADEIVVSDDTGTEEVAAIDGNGSDTTGDYLILETGLDNAYATADNAKERLADWVQHRQLGGGLTKLTNQGFTVSSHIYVGSKNDEVTRAIAAQYYDQVGIGGPGNTNTPPVDPLQLGRDNMETDSMTDAEIQTYLDNVAANDELGILGGHPARDSMTEARAQFVIDEAQARDIEIVTLRKALMHFEAYDYQGRVDLLSEGGVHFDNGSALRETANNNLRLESPEYGEIDVGGTRLANLQPYAPAIDVREYLWMRNGGIHLQRGDPTTGELADGRAMEFLSNGTGTGAAGDLVYAINDAGTIKTSVIAAVSNAT